MKYLFISLVFIVTNYTTNAQYRITGGCGMQLNLGDTDPKPDTAFLNINNILYNGHSYSISAYMRVTGCDGGYGNAELTLGGKTLSSIKNVDVFDLKANTLSLSLDTFHLKPGQYTMTFTFNDFDCGIRSANRSFTIMDMPQKIDPASLLHNDTTTAIPQLVREAEPKEELTIYPVPASHLITIDGVRRSEQNYRLSIINTEGKEMPLYNVTKKDFALLVPCADLPPGFYYVRFISDERNIERKIQILR